MLRKILIIFNPVTLFLLFNILSPKEPTAYDNFNQLENIDYVNIGSSHGADAFEYSNFRNSINLGFDAQRLYYGLRVLESIEHKFYYRTTVIIPISITSFCGKYQGPKQRYLGFIHRDELGISYGQELLEYWFPYLGINKLERYFRMTTTNTLFKNNGLNTANLHLIEAYECNIIDKMIIEKLISFIEKNSESRIVLLITPYYKSYWDQILSEKVVVETLYSVATRIAVDYKIEFLDYSSDPRFSNSSEYFRDSDHLNSFGASYFTEIVINDLSSTN